MRRRLVQEQRTAQEAISLFVETADELRQGGFWQNTVQHGVSFSFALEKDDGPMIDTKFRGLDLDTLKGTLLTLRMFMEQRDSIAAVRLKNSLVSDGDDDRHRRTEALALLDEIKTFLDTPVLSEPEDANVVPELWHPIKDRPVPLTHRDVFNTFLYGRYSHMSVNEHDLYRQWKQSPRFGFFEFTFYTIVDELLCAVFNTADILRREIPQTTAVSNSECQNSHP